MTPLHRRAENALTELARADASLVTGNRSAAVFAQLRRARFELEEILREGGIIPNGQVREHWLDQDAPAEPQQQQAGVISLADAKARRAMGEWR